MSLLREGKIRCKEIAKTLWQVYKEILLYLLTIIFVQGVNKSWLYLSFCSVRKGKITQKVE